MKISIITPSYNQGKYIKETIDSVLNQNYNNFEHIVIDGNSTDETVRILKEYKHLKWISEPDEGPVDALNKGFAMATGEIVTWLNADDYFEKNIFETISTFFQNEAVSILIGNMVVINENKQFIYENNFRKEYNLYSLIRINSDIIRQPSTFFTKKIYDRAGGLDNSLKFVWDYDLFLKMFRLSDPVFIDKIFAYQRIYEQTLSRGFARKQAAEIFKVSRRNGAKIFDKINWLAAKRYLFPGTVSSKPGFFIKFIRNIKQAARELSITVS